MPLRGWWWNHFDDTRTHYKGNHSHLAVWCKACTRFATIRLQNDDFIAVESGTRRSIRSEEDLIAVVRADPTLVRTLCSKPEIMLSHLEACVHSTAELRTAASQELVTRFSKSRKQPNQVNKENIRPFTPLPTPLHADALASTSNNAHGPTLLSPIALSVSRTSSLSTLSQTSNSSELDAATAGRPVKRRQTEAGLGIPIYGDILQQPTHWPDHKQQQFHADLCRLFIACNISWHAVEVPFFRHFFERWMPEAILPGRKALSERILGEEAQHVIAEMKKAVSHHYATGQSDGWKNVSRTSLQASVINVEYTPYLLNVFDMSSMRKDAENLLKFIVAEIEYCKDVLSTSVVAWCTDASGESRKMRRLLGEKFPHIITVDCWAHQINLVVGDYLKVKAPEIMVIDDALEVIKWFTSHTRALGLLKEAMRLRGMKELTLILPVVTRWTSHYLSCVRLLEVEHTIRVLAIDSSNKLLECTGDRAEAQEKAKGIMEIVNSPFFWKCLLSVKQALEPLAIATNLLQSDNARLDTVLVSLGNLYRIFSDDSQFGPSSTREKVLASLERRWKAANQDVFILATFLNPYLRKECFNSSNLALTQQQLWKAYRKIFRQMMKQEPDLEVVAAFEEYYLRTGQFSDEDMCLLEWSQLAGKEGKDVDLVLLWRRLSCHADSDTPPTGVQAFVSFAMRIMSIVPNSAATERVFSKMGAVHGKLRNRLRPDKVRNMVVVREYINKKWPEPHTSRKRRFGGPDADERDVNGINTASIPTPESDDLDVLEFNSDRTLDSFRSIADELIEDTDAMDFDEMYSLDELSTSTIATQTEPLGSVQLDLPSASTSRIQHSIPLSEGRLLRNIFNFKPGSPALTYASHFWMSGVQKLTTDLELHEFLCTDAQEHVRDST